MTINKGLFNNKRYDDEIHQTGQLFISASDFNKMDVSTIKRLNGWNTSDMTIGEEKDVNAAILADIRADVAGQTKAAIFAEYYIES